MQDPDPDGGNLSILLSSDGTTWKAISSDVPIGDGPPMPLALDEARLLLGIRGPSVLSEVEMQLWVGTPVQR